LRISKNQVGTKKNSFFVGGPSIYIFSPSETPSGSEQTQRGGARARAPRISKTGTDPPSPPVSSFVFIRGAHAHAPQRCVSLPHREIRTKMKSGTRKNSNKNFEPKTIFVLSNFWRFGEDKSILEIRRGQILKINMSRHFGRV